MAPASYKKLLREKFPEANRLAIEWLFEGLKLVDTKTRKTLFEKNTVKVALFIGIKEAHRAGFVPKINVVEEELVRSICKLPKSKKMADSISKLFG